MNTVIKTILLLIGIWTLYLVRDLVLAILVSIVIASALEPLVKQLGHWHLPRVPATLLIYLAAFGFVLILLPLFIFPVISDLVTISATLPETLNNIPSFLGTQVSFLGEVSKSFSLTSLFSAFQEGLSSLPKGFIQTASLVFGGFFSFVLIIVFSFYLTVQPNGLESFLRLITPLSRENYVLDLWRRSRQKIGYWMQGQLLLGLLIGVLVFLGLTIFKVKYALVLALLAAVFELIPYFGPILAAVPAVILGFSQSITLGFIILGFYIIIQQFENHLICPLVVTKIVGVPPLMVILSLLIGAKLAGFLGIILAVPAAAILMELASDFEKRKRLSRQAS